MQIQIISKTSFEHGIFAQNICMALFESLAHRKWASSVDKMLDLDTYGLLLNSLSFQAKQLAIALQSIKKN